MKVLFITSQNILGNIYSGGQQGTKKNYEILKRVFGFQNTFLLIISKKMKKNEGDGIFTLPGTANPLEDICVSLLGYRKIKPTQKNNIKFILDSVEPDIIFLDSSELGIITKWINKKTVCIVNFHNIEVDYIWKNKIKRMKIYSLPILIATYYNEKKSVSRANKIICLNERDSRRLRKIYKKNHDLILPVGFEDKFNQSKLIRKTEEYKLIFIGSLFPPNYQGIEWFVNNVMVELKEFELLIIGKDFEKKRVELERNNVKVIGTVENLEEYYYSYCSVVMPILYGDGMKVKTAEAMMYGMNIFATEEALEGYKVSGVEGIYKCQTKDEFIYNIRMAYKNRKISSYNESVRKLFLENHSLNVQEDIMKKMIGNIK